MVGLILIGGGRGKRGRGGSNEVQFPPDIGSQPSTPVQCAGHFLAVIKEKPRSPRKSNVKFFSTILREELSDLKKKIVCFWVIFG